MKKRHRISIDSIEQDPDLTPLMDNLLLDLMKQAHEGRLDVYFGVIPIARIAPFDFDYRPDHHPVGAEAINTFYSEWKQGHFRKLLVYPRGVWFIVSDHYITLFAALRGRVEFLPCWILGKPEDGLVKDLQGPIVQEDVSKILGLA